MEENRVKMGDTRTRRSASQSLLDASILSSFRKLSCRDSDSKARREWLKLSWGAGDGHVGLQCRDIGVCGGGMCSQ